MIRINACFYIDSGEKVWIDLFCSNNALTICTVSHELTVKSRRIGKYIDRIIRRIVIERQKYLKCEEIPRSGENDITVIGRKKIDTRLYLIVEISGFPHRVYVPYSKERLLKRCIMKKL